MPSLLERADRRRGLVVALTTLALVAGLVAVPRAAHAYCRTTTQPLPANYNPASRGCYTQGLFLFWRSACVGFSINQDASKNIPFADAKRIIDAAFGTWVSSKCSDGEAPGIAVSDMGAAECAEVRYNPDTANQNLIVFRDTNWPYRDPNNTLGLTTVTFDADSGEIFDADMEINSSGHNLSITDQVPANGFDLASVITHEAGHFLGLAHATSSTSTMYASYKPGTTALRTLSPDDVAGLCAIYPNTQTRIVSPTATQPETLAASPCDPTPRHGLTAVCAPDKPSESKCAATPEPARRWSTTADVLLAAAGLIAVRRRHARARRR
jgi:hypothetical protein